MRLCETPRIDRPAEERSMDPFEGSRRGLGVVPRDRSEIRLERPQSFGCVSCCLISSRSESL